MIRAVTAGHGALPDASGSEPWFVFDEVRYWERLDDASRSEGGLPRVVDCHSSPEGTLLKLIKTERNRFSVILHVDFAEREDAKW